MSKHKNQNFPGGPFVESSPSKARDVVSILGWGTKIPHAIGQLSLHTATGEACTLQRRSHAAKTATTTKTKPKTTRTWQMENPRQRVCKEPGEQVQTVAAG